MIFKFCTICFANYNIESLFSYIVRECKFREDKVKEEIIKIYRVKESDLELLLQKIQNGDIFNFSDEEFEKINDIVFQGIEKIEFKEYEYYKKIFYLIFSIKKKELIDIDLENLKNKIIKKLDDFDIENAILDRCECFYQEDLFDEENLRYYQEINQKISEIISKIKEENKNKPIKKLLDTFKNNPDYFINDWVFYDENNFSNNDIFNQMPHEETINIILNLENKLIFHFSLFFKTQISSE